MFGIAQEKASNSISSDKPGGPDEIKERLAEVLPLVWDTIPEEFFEKLWRSMSDRVAAVIEARGWYTKY
jgi:hypothetical protein